MRSSPGLINDVGRSWFCFWPTTRETSSSVLKSLPILLCLMTVPLQALNCYSHTDKSESLSLTGLSLGGDDGGNWDLNSNEIMQSGFWSWAMCVAATMQHLTMHMAAQLGSDAEHLGISSVSWRNCRTLSFKLTQGCEEATTAKKRVQINWGFFSISTGQCIVLPCTRYSETSEICGNRYPQIPNLEHYRILLAMSSEYLNLFSRSEPEMKSAASSGELEEKASQTQSMNR